MPKKRKASATIAVTTATAPAAALGARIAAARHARGLSQEAAAWLIPTAANTWARWEQGRHEPSVAMLRRIAEILETPLVEFFRGQ